MLFEKQIELIEKLKQGLDALKEILESEKKVDNKPFPKEYHIPIHTLVKRVDGAYAFTYRVAICTWHGPLVKITCETEGGEYTYHCTPDCLYPVNPEDHPEHPEFGKGRQYVWEDMLDKLKQERPMDAETIASIVYGSSTYIPQARQELVDKINALVQYEVKRSVAGSAVVFSVSPKENVIAVVKRMNHLIGFPLKNTHPNGPVLQIFEVVFFEDEILNCRVEVKYGFIDAKIRKNEFLAKYEFRNSTDFFSNIVSRDVEQSFIHFVG